LCHLWEQHTYDQRLHLLTGALPLVAMALQAAGMEQPEGELFIAAGGRVLQRESDPTLWNACWESLPDPIQARLEQERSALVTMAVPPMQDDGIWEEVREEWEQFTRDVARQTRDSSLETFLSYANFSKGEADDQDDHQLGMMTIHAAKGKEFKVVFLVGVEEKEMPSWRSKSAEEQEEERRVAYVGMSRAADTLYLLGCEYRNGYSRAPSRYWRELDVLFR
jgi:hypothetical protein